ncbi:uncharacterized protein BUCNMO_368 [Buchnera aphidicola (Nipponaphis monzeni)]|uniref:UPF0250 protein BUCNMO_368 n=1 Tax=Buchnera aphidicola (Nipponaphis monzeni) TaxID=2495405 RepID=A0A455TAN0_9GAMM|nr:DUF493 family protein YbeD [Buchnera aphidicola]BBI01370.1 uncharacterized protein BUCNMO_368 [Buchnera aphidicola (Nipponaphis monzeni)]
MEKKLKSMLTFPCSFTYKIIGTANPELVDNIIKVIQLQIPGDYTPQIKSSNKGNYISISVTIHANNLFQIKNLYYELSKINMVKIIF